MEQEFEENICDGLAKQGWLYSGDASTEGWDVELALHVPDVLAWLASEYPKEFAKAVPDSATGTERTLAERRLAEHVSKQLGARVKVDKSSGGVSTGLLGVLRRGFKYTQIGHGTAVFGPMAAFYPANPMLTSAVEAAERNRLRVLRQVRFDTKTSATIDVVLCVNGIPVATMEVKTDNTQSVHHAIAQYKNDRVPSGSRTLLKPGRALVHLAVSNSEVYMATKLAGQSTKFLPFNRGTADGHAGNDPSPTGSATDYLWNTVLARPLLLRILSDYAVWQTSVRGQGKSTSGGFLIFPRFHQLRAVEKVTADIARRHREGQPGGKYLVWHSAGSGKTKTIAWLSHRLIRLNNAEGNKVFDTVIAITDRTVLDENIREDIMALHASDGLVVPVGEKGGAKSPLLRKSLAEGGHIITCTLQTFPEVLKLLDGPEGRTEFAGRTWCVIADEAHSSQTGSSAVALRRLLADTIGTDADDDGEPLTGDDLLAASDKAVADAVNMTYVAFTATPKAKTLRLFGTQGDADTWRAFDTYTMAQAIEEGFILDVLGNYSTYDMFAEVRDEIGRTDYVRKGEAVSDMVRFVRLHPTSIAQKVEVVIEHFRKNVQRHLGGKAKAMVVTDSRIAAVRWSQAMNAYIADKGYEDGMRAMVAFSGTVTDDGAEFTEAGMNGRSDTADGFRDEDIYKVLIVAEKFQTGFDEPKLCAMYVDKKLSGIAAVQTLSRLNRTYPHKPTPMVLDFVNTPEQIQGAFQMYYSDAYINTDVDPNAIHVLADELDGAGLYSEQEMLAVASAYMAQASGEEMRVLCEPVVDRWRKQYLQARAEGDKDTIEELKAFRSNLKKYIHAWEFLSQIVSYEDTTLSKRAMFASVVVRNLTVKDNAAPADYRTGLELVGLEHVPDRVQQDFTLVAGSEEPIELPGFDGTTHGSASPVQETFDKVVDEVNKLLKSANIDTDREVTEGFIRTSWSILSQDGEVARLAKENTEEQIAKSGKFKDKLNQTFFKVSQQNAEIATAIAIDPEMIKAVQLILAALAKSSAIESE